jgi:hypothetical protein
MPKTGCRSLSCSGYILATSGLIFGVPQPRVPHSIQARGTQARISALHTRELVGKSLKAQKKNAAAQPSPTVPRF